MLIGLFFWMPWLGLAIGAVVGAITGALSDYGINDDFIKEVGATIKPGGSAMFLLISKWTEDKAMEIKQLGTGANTPHFYFPMTFLI
jgi:uncharacterized membrane protein